MLLLVLAPTWLRTILGVIGALPHGDGLKEWIKRDPVLSQPAFQVPIMIHEYGDNGIPDWWEVFVAMMDYGMPVEYHIFETEGHDPTSYSAKRDIQLLTIDWFSYWLNSDLEGVSNADSRRRWDALAMQGCQNSARILSEVCAAAGFDQGSENLHVGGNPN